MTAGDSGLMRQRGCDWAPPPAYPVGDERTRRHPEVQLATSRDPYGPLALAASQGDREATQQLLRVLAPRLLSAIRALVGRTHPDLEDMLQDSLMAVVNALPAFEGRSTVLHYAYRITIRTCMAGRKRARILDQRVELMEAPDDLASRAPSQEVGVDYQRREAVRSLINELPDVQAETMALRVCLGMSLEEVASATGAPVNTVRSRIRLARQALRRRIETDPALAELLEPTT